MISFKYAIFDMDGTLVDSMPAWRYTQLDSIERLYNVKFTDEERERLVYLTYTGVINEVNKLKNIEINFNDLSELNYSLVEDRYANGDFECKPYIKEFLAYLKKNGVGVGVATATKKSICVPFLEKIGLSDYIDCVFTTDEDAKIGKRKSSLVYDMTLEALGGTKEEAVVFEDVLHCMQTCKSNGYRVIAIHDEYQKYTKSEILKVADLFINTYKELME